MAYSVPEKGPGLWHLTFKKCVFLKPQNNIRCHRRNSSPVSKALLTRFRWQGTSGRSQGKSGKSLKDVCSRLWQTFWDSGARSPGETFFNLLLGFRARVASWGGSQSQHFNLKKMRFPALLFLGVFGSFMSFLPGMSLAILKVICLFCRCSRIHKVGCLMFLSFSLVVSKPF